MRLHAGATFAGYLIMDRLGRGGMATVYLAREPQVDRLVALKVLPEHLVDEGDFARRFEQEARVIAGLDHPNIIPLYRFGIDQDVPWMALRYVDGGDLAANLARYPLTADAGLTVLRAIGAALDYAHSRNVIHRDLKPQNVLLTASGACYLADFGIAKLLEGSEALKTATGGIIGTPAYMAPEQAQGATPTPATDVYALAVMAFQWLTGSLPFDADTPQAVLLKHVSEPVPTQALRSLSPAVASVVVRGLAKQPEQRYRTAGALIAELEDALNARVRATGTTVKPDFIPPVSSRTAATTSGSSRRWMGIGLIVFALMSAIVGYLYWPPGPKPVVPDVPEQTAQSQGQADDTEPTPQPADEQADTETPGEQEDDATDALATLIVRTTSRCELRVNGQTEGTLFPHETRSITVNAGEQFVDCISAEPGRARAKETLSVAAGAQQVVVLEPAQYSQFVEQGDGVIKDNQSGLEWTESDNGRNVDWNAAREYCASRGDGWRLPSVGDLLGIYDETKSMSTRCGTGQICNVSPLFDLTSWWFWSGETKGSADAFAVLLNSGVRTSTPAGTFFAGRALCVRRP